MADIVRAHRASLEATGALGAAHRKVLSAMTACRTEALGGHVDVCRSCGDTRPSYNSCRNRHCPKCQGLAQERWIAARSQRLLSVPHFHVVFTLPSELRSLTKRYPRLVFDALFHAAGETLADLAARRMSATLGVTMVLHTWTRDLRFHPHVHALVTAGGLHHDGASWVHSNRRHLFPVHVMGTLLRAKMMCALRRMHARGDFDGFEDFADPQAYDRLMARLARCAWVVYAKRPFRRSNHVLHYLGRYTHRVAIANSRITRVTDEHVTFRTKNGNVTTLRGVEFLRRFVQHVLPEGFKKIRHHGLYASSNVDGALALAHVLCPRAGVTADARVVMPWPELVLVLTGRDVARCSRCGGLVDRLPLPERLARAPPRTARGAA